MKKKPNGSSGKVSRFRLVPSMHAEVLDRIQNMRLGSKKTFGTWKLVWECGDATYCHTISSTLALRLLECGMPVKSKSS